MWRLLVSVFLLSFLPTACVNTNKEIANWNWNNYPMVCSPLSLQRGDISDRVWKVALKAPSWLEKRLGRPLYQVNGKGIPVVLYRNPRCNVPTIGYTVRVPSFGSPTQRFEVYLCFDSIRIAEYYQGLDQSVRNMGRLGILGHIVHELLHPYMGDRVGHSHPRTSAALMAAAPRSTDVGPVTKGVIKRVEMYCKRRRK